MNVSSPIALRIVVVAVESVRAFGPKQESKHAPMHQYFYVTQPGGVDQTGGEFHRRAQESLGPCDDARAQEFASTMLDGAVSKDNKPQISVFGRVVIETYVQPTAKDLTLALEAGGDLPIVLIMSCPTLPTGMCLIDAERRGFGVAFAESRLTELLDDHTGKLKLVVLCTDNSTTFAPALQRAGLAAVVTFSPGPLPHLTAESFLECVLEHLARGADPTPSMLREIKHALPNKVKGKLPDEAGTFLVTQTPAPSRFCSGKIRFVFVAATPAKMPDGSALEMPPWRENYVALQESIARETKNCPANAPMIMLVGVHDASVDDLITTLKDDVEVPTVLLLACRQVPDAPCIRFAQHDDREVADVRPVEEVFRLIKSAGCNLQSLLFLTSKGSSFASCYQGFAGVAHFTTFSHDTISSSALVPIVSTFVGKIARNSAHESLYHLIEATIKKVDKCCRLLGEIAARDAVKHALQTFTMPLDD